MLLSIITINRNNAAGLRKTMESVVNQTTFNQIEYIVIDGASADGSKEIIESYAHKLTYWVSEPDSGIYSAMNKGIIQAKGEYCQFLNSGDWLTTPNSTQLMLSNMPECSILYGNMVKQMPGGKVFYNKLIPTSSLLTFYTGTLNHSPAYIKRSLFEKYGLYDESLMIVSDWKFFLIAIGLNNESVCYRDIDVTCFEMNGISNTNSYLEKTERRKVLQEVIPQNILTDYDHYAFSIQQMKRINRFKITRRLVWIIDRVLFKIEKREMRKKKEHLFFN